ncbi:hypothetical protein EDD80_102335 [Anseongella ginsenosidimutans]|uniref:Uncharacterized protein n=1 Tax=Anseongella ginsenosidimutans TaxID=496056 RepID=A0A4R3KVK0_9SPHI|nr:hypothetical protein [Anseongella ginsenosidimutans]QEC51772.1 hypothetical protein FRZ59_05080 [Anseongella ginsenosidimutans]TCS89141.1 hypothetical protein EDD80_102335 [Anseongella ginsenosidimutans]
MNDRLRHFIDNHRGEFDVHEPPQRVWKNIEKEFFPRQRFFSPFFSVLKVAAVIAVLLTVSFLAVRQLMRLVEPEERIVNNINPSAARQQAQYISLIETKRSELRQLQQSEPELYAEFAEEIESLETGYASLKSQLTAAPDQALVLEAMIQNLRYQIELLNRQLEIIQKINEAKKERGYEESSANI